MRECDFQRVERFGLVWFGLEAADSACGRADAWASVFCVWTSGLYDLGAVNVDMNLQQFNIE